jgi:hypothetical protein
MDTYEIRIARKGIKSTDIYSSSHISDHAAVRRAQNLAASDDIVEVWRGASCVYSGAQDLMPAPISASRIESDERGN